MDTLKKNGLDKVDFIKMDAEGAELSVLKGATELLRNHRPIILCELADVSTKPWGYPAAHIYQFLIDNGYRWFSITTDGYLRHCPIKETFHENLIAIPEEKMSLLSDLILEK